MNQEEKAEVLSQMQKGLPPYWIARFSTKHKSRIFYYNKDTGETTWKYPVYAKKRSNTKVKTKERNKKTSFKGAMSKVKSSTSFKIPKEAGIPKCRMDEESLKFFECSGSSVSTSSYSSAQSKGNSDEHSTGKGSTYTKKDTTKLSISNDEKSRNISKTGVSNTGISFQVTSHSRLDKSLNNKRNMHKNTSINRHNPYDCTLRKETLASNIAYASKITQNSLNINHCKESSLLQDFSNDSADWRNPLMDKNAPSVADVVIKPDVEMADISLQSDSRCNQPLGILFVVVDTNVFLSSEGTRDIDTIIDLHSVLAGKFRRAVVVVPWIVMQELDHLKANSKIAKKARNAITYLNRHFFAKKPGIRGQTILEAASVIEGLKVEVNDDRILQCCFFFSHLPGNHKTVLFSRDSNLCNKAMINNFWAFTNVAAVIKGVESTFQAHCVSYDTKQCSVTYNQSETAESFEIKSPGKESVTSLLASNEWKKEEVYFKAQDFCKSALAYILEFEMKKAYDNMWEEIVCRKPPWSLRDVLYCFKKHWIAVFAMCNFDRLLLVHVDNLLENLKCYGQQGKMHLEDNTIKDFLYGAIQLISGVSIEQKSNNVIKESLTTLKELFSNYAKAIANPSKQVLDNKDVNSDCVENQGDAYEIEMCNVDITDTTSRELCQIFWQVLDQIWISIISHCAAIFKSLNFMTSTTFQHAPLELQQQLNTDHGKDVPTAEMSIQVFPLLMKLMEGLLNALERFLLACKKDESAAIPLSECLDLLQTLWTITQAFTLQTCVESINPTTVQHCCKNQEGKSQLFTGHQKLLAACNVMKDCANYVRRMA